MRQKRVRRIAAVMLLVALAAGLGLWSAAQEPIPTVTYTDGAAAHFSFSNTGSGSETDLFPAFKGCMPGDSLTQTIHVRADKSNNPKGAKLYLRAEIDGDAGARQGSGLTYDDVLRHIRITVANAAAPAVPLASSAAANLLGEAAGAVLLGTVRPGAAPLELVITIAIDPAMGNAFQEAAAHIVWVFSANENAAPTPPPLEREEHFAYIAGYPDGMIHPNANITRAEVAAIFFRLLTDEARAFCWSETSSYTDVPQSSWYGVAVSSLSSIGILAGYPDGTFHPNAPITRAEFTAIAMRFVKAASTDGPDRFADISTSWARDAINAAAALGIISGYPDGTFGPEKGITRAEVFTIINNLLGRAPHRDYLLDEMTQWPDNADPNAWYYAIVQEATNSHDYIRDGGHEVWQSLRPGKFVD